MTENIPRDSEPSNDAAATDTITFKRSHFYAAIVPVAFVIGLAVGFLLWGTDTPTQPSAVSVAEAQQPAPQGPQLPQGSPTPIVRIPVSVDDDPAFGPVDAPITIIEFSDFECPFCARFHRQTLQPLIDAYPNQIRFVYRDFPLTSIHPNAQSAAVAAECAHEQGRFWEFHDLLYLNQHALGPALYTEAATTLGLNLDTFQECLQSDRYASEVLADFNEARSIGITGTPTFFINGRPLVGAQPLEVFASIIEEELAAASEE